MRFGEERIKLSAVGLLSHPEYGVCNDCQYSRLRRGQWPGE